MGSEAKGDMPKCFVIQPFDKGEYDKRYNDVLKPVIEAAGLEAYRVDQDPSASIPIEKIEEGIKGAAPSAGRDHGEQPERVVRLAVRAAGQF